MIPERLSVMQKIDRMLNFIMKHPTDTIHLEVEGAEGQAIYNELCIALPKVMEQGTKITVIALSTVDNRAPEMFGIRDKTILESKKK